MSKELLRTESATEMGPFRKYTPRYTWLGMRAANYSRVVPVNSEKTEVHNQANRKLHELFPICKGLIDYSDTGTIILHLPFAQVNVWNEDRDLFVRTLAKNTLHDAVYGYRQQPSGELELEAMQNVLLDPHNLRHYAPEELGLARHADVLDMVVGAVLIGAQERK